MMPDMHAYSRDTRCLVCMHTPGTHDAGYACIFQGHMMPGSCMHMQRRFVHAYACMHMQRRVCTHIACLLQFRTVYDMMLNRE